MQLPRLRLHVRTLLIAVAVAGTALGGWQMWRRREYCLERAGHYDGLVINATRLDDLGRSDYRRRAARFRHVARYPWLPPPREPE